MSSASAPVGDRRFGGSVAALYERLLVPLIFQPYADELAARVAAGAPRRVLEIAAGTGVVTRALAKRLRPDATLMATDLNAPMLAEAQSRGTAREVQWGEADAMALPFPDASFDAVVCQFGAMFFPDKARAFAEARRVLAPGGRFLFNVWDRIEDNHFANVVTRALATVFPDDPPRFMARIPHGYHDLARIRADLGAGGFQAAPLVETINHCSRADAPDIPAIAYCQGTPLRNEIEAREGAGLDEATDAATAAIAARFGSGPVEGRIRAHVLVAGRDATT